MHSLVQQPWLKEISAGHTIVTDAALHTVMI